MANYPIKPCALKFGTLHPGYPTLEIGYGLLYFTFMLCAVSKKTGYPRSKVLVDSKII